MKRSRSLSQYLLLPIAIAVSGTLLILLISLYTLKEQSQSRAEAVRKELLLLEEVASLGQSISDSHLLAMSALRRAASGELDEAGLYRIHSQIVNTLAEAERRTEALAASPQVQHLKDYRSGSMLVDFRNYRNNMIMATDNAVIDPAASSRHIYQAQEYMLDYARQRQILSQALAREASHATADNILDFENLFVRVVVGSLLGLMVMATLALVAGKFLSQRLTTIVSALDQLRDKEYVPAAMPAIERLRDDSIKEIASMGEAVMAYRASILDRQVAHAELTRYHEQLEQLVDERTASLRSSEARLADAQQIAHLGNWEWEISSGALYWSDEVYRIFGWQPQEFTADIDRFMAAVHDEDRELLRQELDRALAEPNYEYHAVHRIVRADGTQRHLREVGRVVRNAAGSPLKMVGIVLDITDMVSAQQDLELYRLMIEKSADPVFLIDIEAGFRMAYVNEAAVDHYGAPREKILTWTIPDWDPNFTQDDLPGHLERIKQHEGEGLMIETLHRIKGGVIVPVEVTLNLTRYRGRLFHFGYIRNIAARKQAEQELLRAKQLAEEATRAKSEFLANMSHEIRTPMNAVINLSRLVLQTKLDDRQRDYLQKVVRSGENLMAIINDILDFSKIEAGKMTVEAIPFALSQVVDDTVDVINHRLKNDAVEFLVDLPADLNREVIGDPLRLGQVLINLLGNAIKFTEKGTVLLAIDRVSQDERSVLLDFIVCDSGIGMSREQQARLFTAFSQADGSTTRRFGGTGLGLTISRNLLSLMGATIHLESESGVGSTFSFTLRLPLAEERGATLPAIAQPHHLHVLAVDDNPTALQIVHDLVSGFGVRIAVAESGANAVTIARQACATGAPFTLLLVDWKMPGMDGLELISSIAADAAIEPKPRAVLITAYGAAEIQAKALASGFTAVLDKPLSASRLYDLLLLTGGDMPRVREAVAEEITDIDTVAARLSGARVLLVEDNDINQEIAAELLNAVDVDVMVANDGLEALSALEHDQFDLVLMDLQMPRMDGYEATRLIREQVRWKELPIVAMTAHALQEERERCLAAGMNDHLAKPIDVALLYETLLRWIRPTSAADAPRSAPGTESSHLPARLAGIDLAKGVERVGHNHALYRTLLKRFMSGQQQTAEQLLSAIAESNHEEARRIAHTLKGVAGNLGAEPLALAAATLEHALAGDGELSFDEQTQNLLDELQRVLDSLATLEGAPPPKTPEAAGAAHQAERDVIAPLLKQLLAVLESDLREARGTLEELAPHLLHTRLQKESERLAAALTDYDTDAAAEQIRAIAAALDLEL